MPDIAPAAKLSLHSSQAPTMYRLWPWNVRMPLVWHTSPLSTLAGGRIYTREYHKAFMTEQFHNNDQGARIDYKTEDHQVHDKLSQSAKRVTVLQLVDGQTDDFVDWWSLIFTHCGQWIITSSWFLLQKGSSARRNYSQTKSDKKAFDFSYTDSSMRYGRISFYLLKRI